MFMITSTITMIIIPSYSMKWIILSSLFVSLLWIPLDINCYNNNHHYHHHVRSSYSMSSSSSSYHYSHHQLHQQQPIRHQGRNIIKETKISSNTLSRRCRLHQRTTIASSAASTDYDDSSIITTMTKNHDIDYELIIQQFMTSYNEQNINSLANLLSNDIIWNDYNFDYKPCIGLNDIIKRFQFQWQLLPTSSSTPIITIKNTMIDAFNIGLYIDMNDYDNNKNQKLNTKRGIILIKLRYDDEQNNNEDNDIFPKIYNLDWITESTYKAGETSLYILSLVGKFLELSNKSNNNNQLLTSSSDHNITTTPTTLPELYFQAWNIRNMSQAISYFASNVTYDDTAFSDKTMPLRGIDMLLKHLVLCSNSLPKTFRFITDHIYNDNNNNHYVVMWHVENRQEALPFSNGMSFYTTIIEDDNDNNDNDPTTSSSSVRKIYNCIDFVEPVIRIGPIQLFFNVCINQLRNEPIRFIPFIVWILYIYIVFFSNNIIPGANVMSMEIRTWEEVRDLSINFFLVAPILNLSFSPIVHPMLESIFNILLSWAAMFIGFISDDNPRNKKLPNIIPILPIIIGMQFLTSAFLLPYLCFRSSESSITTITSSSLLLPSTISETNDTSVTIMDYENNNDKVLNVIQNIGENKYLGILLSFVGIISIIWSIYGRTDIYGDDLLTRYISFCQLLSIDRVGCSFIIDLIIFALFQNWFINDDMIRRTNNNNTTSIINPIIIWCGKYIPYFGLSIYFYYRPSLLSSSTITSTTSSQETINDP